MRIRGKKHGLGVIPEILQNAVRQNHPESATAACVFGRFRVQFLRRTPKLPRNDIFAWGLAPDSHESLWYIRSDFFIGFNLEMINL